MKVRKVGVLTEQNEIVGQMNGDIAAILTNLGGNDPIAKAASLFTLSITIGKGIKSRKITLACSIPNSILDAQLKEPVLVGEAGFCLWVNREYNALMMFQNQFFVATTPCPEATAFEEAVLQIKKLVYSEDNKLKRLRQEVVAMERVLSQKGVQCTPISEAVKLLVWTRDEGKCVRCGSSENLHFDHIIPVAKGGGNSENNIQILCERCNLQKSDRITF